MGCECFSFNSMIIFHDKAKQSISELILNLQTPVLGSFSKEQRDFVESRRRKKAEEEASVAPWCGYDSPEAEEMRKQILALSSDERNFLRNPPKGAQYCYDSEASAPVAMAVLAEDPQLRDMRFKLVPKR